MRYLVGFLILCVIGLAVFLVGCLNSCDHRGCADEVGVDLVPGIEGTYDVTLVLDGEAGAFTCGWNVEVGAWILPDVVGAADAVERCTGRGFFLRGTPESVEITVNAEDGSWNGSLTTSPTYRIFQPNGPDCPPTCRIAPLTITNDVGALEVQP